jgi:hypothetical protein
MRNKFIIIFFLGVVFGLYADETKSITIKEIGEHNITWYSVIINTHALEQGLQLEGRRFFYCYAIDESTFDELIDFINNNKELFGERQLYPGSYEYGPGPYGSVELFIDNKGMKYYLYLVERKTSAMFFYGLLELIKNKGKYNEIVTRLELSIKYFGFDLLLDNCK